MMPPRTRPSKDPVRTQRRLQRGYTLVEVLLAAALLSAILAGLSGITGNALDVRERGMTETALAQEAQFAMERMVTAVRNSPELIVPMPENFSTGSLESLFDPGVLAVRMDPTLDRDLDGFADADNDRDGRVDEDFPRDANRDGRVGIGGIDDDNSGFPDFSFGGTGDDDETASFGGADEDPIDGIDNDGDGAIDEDPGADMNGDGAPGIASVDDDGDGSIDEGDRDDDDEDGAVDEDWRDEIVYFLTGTSLMERHPNPSPSDGNDFTERVIADRVSTFRVERMPRNGRRTDLVEITLVVTSADGDLTTNLSRQVRVNSRAD